MFTRPPTSLRNAFKVALIRAIVVMTIPTAWMVSQWYLPQLIANVIK